MAKFKWQASVFSGSPSFPAPITTQVTVLDKSDDTLASLWSDRDGTASKSNPFTLDEPGKIEFYADPGRYDITATVGGNSDTWEDVILEDPDAGGGGSSSFTGLSDTPANYTSSGGKTVKVNSAANALEFGRPEFNVEEVTTSYTLAAAYDNRMREITGSGTVDITVPAESTVDLGAGFTHYVRNHGSGTVTIVAAGGVTVQSPAGGTLVIPQHGTVGITKSTTAADTWIVYGQVQAS